MGDIGCINLLTWIEGNETLKSLSIAENKLTDVVAEPLAYMLAKNATLDELYLSWNNFSSVGGELIFKSLAKRESLKVLDMAWNSLGSNMKVIKKNALSFVDTLCSFISNNRKMVHLSLTNNGFSYEESQKIAEVTAAYLTAGVEQEQVHLRISLFRQLRIH